MTAPSMIIPKSMAPRLIKFASTPKIYIKDKAKNKHIGITEPTTKPERKFPNKSTTTKITIRQPKMRFSAMVKVVLPINSLRSKNGLILTPGGSEGEICSTLFLRHQSPLLSWHLLTSTLAPRLFRLPHFQ